jgi:bile-acid 7alpha-dehydratase
MSDLADLARRLQRLEDIEAIKQLKYRYWRHLDLKQWKELALCFEPDATVCYSSGKYEFSGVAEIMRFLSESLSKERGSITIHQGHHPEIELLGDDRAHGTWALYNYMFNEKENRGIRIGAFYHDDYAKRAGEWRFTHIGYTYIFHEEWTRDDIPSLHLMG